MNVEDLSFIYYKKVLDFSSIFMKISLKIGIFNQFGTKILEIFRITERLLKRSECLSDTLEKKTRGIQPTINFWADLNFTKEDLSEDMLQDIPDSSASVPGNSERLISNQCLIELGITLNYPTFREGMS